MPNPDRHEMSNDDAKLCEILLGPLRKCLDYKPAFGGVKGSNLNYDDFRAIYEADPFYNWMGLAVPGVYSAHKAAGGLTSVYRQLGIGAERLICAILASRLSLTPSQLTWEYTYSKPNGKTGVHKLDAKIETADLREDAKKRIDSWLSSACVTAQTEKQFAPKGVVFEIRQGYKSADSKRQNADLRFGMRASQASLLPVFLILSTQVTEPVILRYSHEGMLVLRGTLDNDATTSTFAFMKEVVGYDLCAFFRRNKDLFKEEIQTLVQGLLTT